MPRTGRPRKQYENAAKSLHAAQAADRRAILVARNRVKKTEEWTNASDKEKKAILERVKQDVISDRENRGMGGKYPK